MWKKVALKRVELKGISPNIFLTVSVKFCNRNDRSALFQNERRFTEMKYAEVNIEDLDGFGFKNC